MILTTFWVSALLSILTKGTAAPIQFPEGRSSNVDSRSRDRLRTITPYNSNYLQHNANYNRLVYNRVTVNDQNNDEYDDYDDTVVKPDNTATITGSTTEAVVNDDDEQQQDNLPSQQDYDLGIRRRRKKRPCIPVQYGYRTDSNGKTILNLQYSDTNINTPIYYPNGGYHQQYPQQSYYPQHGGYQQPLYNPYGGYACVPNYGGHHRPQRPHRPHRPHRPGGGYPQQGGGYQPGYQGGPLGFFGPGGLFDFSNSGNNQDINQQSPVNSDSVSDNDNDIKPVFEINVPDTISDAVYRPGDLVGGIANSVTGFLQQISNRPGQVVRQINREINSVFVKPFYDLFR